VSCFKELYALTLGNERTASTRYPMPMPANMAPLLRQNRTWAERKLWRVLRDRRFSGYKFRRQHRVGPYYLDFFCAEARYNVELDGRQHGFPEQKQKDAQRDSFLREEHNILVRRFWNRQLSDIQWVRDTIWADIQARAPHPGNVNPVVRTRISSRPPRGIVERSHPSPRPSPR
jgi:very-short-patch-repair endonuclease